MHRRALTVAVAFAAAALLAGCAPSPVPPVGSPVAPSAAPTSGAPGASPTSSPSPTPTGTIALPPRCEGIYSPAMLATLTTQVPPLNDPGVTMYSTQNADGLDLLGSGIPTLRCSWGKPSSVGLATNVSIVTAAQSAALRQSLQNQGFACAPAHGGTLCTLAQQMPQGDTIVKMGEYQFLRGNGWVTTRWITADPAGYMADIVATLWG